MLRVSINKDVAWLLELQSRSRHNCRNNVLESLSEEKQTERKMKKNICPIAPKIPDNEIYLKRDDLRFVLKSLSLFFLFHQRNVLRNLKQLLVLFEAFKVDRNLVKETK